MAIAVDIDLAWATDTDYNTVVTSGTFSPGANTLIVAVVASTYNNAPASLTNSGTALTWTLQQQAGPGGAPGLRVYTAPNTSAQSNITVTWDAVGIYDYPALKIYVLSGLNATPISTKGGDVGASGTSLTLPPTTWNSSYNDALVFVAVNDNGYNGAMTSSDLTETADTSYLHVMAGYKQVPTSGTSMISSVTRAGTTGTAEWIAIEFRAGATTHTASASPSFTASRTAAVTLEAVAGATRSTTATTTAAAAVERAAAASLASTATTTAAATVEKVAAASLTVTASTSASPVGEVAGAAALAATATVTATADVSTPGVVSIAASLPVTATPAVAAVLERVAAATAATTATVTAAADVSTPGSHSADASVSVTATLTAAASVNRNAAASLAVTSSITVAGALDEETTRGLMAGIERAASTMTPITGAGSPPRRVSLLSFDVATMTALVSMTQVPGLAGVPVFIGGDSSPEAAGLVDAGEPYLWISDGVVYYEDGS